MKENAFSSVQLLSHVQLFATPWTAACQASLSITNSWSLLKLMSLKLVMPPNHLILCCPPSSPVFNLSHHQGLFQWVSSASGGQTIGVSASTLVLQMNIQDWSPLEWTGWISLRSKRIFFFFIFFIFKMYITVLVLPNIKMNPPQVYTTWLS